ncbi:MAG: hypothetical protein KJ798_09015 [Gammaproteobacteria bacterium]|uniref:hypothetical protein n=2 Tax=Limnobacter sp. TaxID=2003368 RepID=UPI001DB29BF5|nr:hypothetical protein [Limnobacter sp.]MBU0783285.1 hypothetical protein [Gammaproteobacteria bacterium]MBU0850504.1 hypothetical protein [Gammaproteobacteria bacterium]MBU1267112.1 hypothetical protein [Gammaproteobacteria bacterium]MBU1529497.1 hypothetical protein [Gammaproteobacteria bacterium]MBU1780516.1 hypothetical protein [Gammaproteobacteria bacterium]
MPLTAFIFGSPMNYFSNKFPTVLPMLLATTLLQGCAVVSATAGAAISITGAVVSTGIKVTGAVVEAGIDAVSDDDKIED